MIYLVYLVLSKFITFPLKISLFQNTFLVILIIATVTAIEVSEKDVIKAPLDIISLDDITPEERKEIAELEEKINRSKRYVHKYISTKINITWFICSNLGHTSRKQTWKTSLNVFIFFFRILVAIHSKQGCNLNSKVNFS